MENYSTAEIRVQTPQGSRQIGLVERSILFATFYISSDVWREDVLAYIKIPTEYFDILELYCTRAAGSIGSRCGSVAT